MDTTAISIRAARDCAQSIARLAAKLRDDAQELDSLAQAILAEAMQAEGGDEPQRFIDSCLTSNVSAAILRAMNMSNLIGTAQAALNQADKATRGRW